MKLLLIITISIFSLFIFLETYKEAIPENHGKVQAKLYLGKAENQPLIVGFGGSEGGNSWARNFWKKTRDEFVDKGYAFLALGYFGSDDTSDVLDRISLNAIHETIIKITDNPKIDGSRIALIGGSKGGELVLNLASYFEEIDAVVALAPSHVSFPAITMMSNTSSWTLNNTELPFVPLTYSALPSLFSGKMLEAYQMILEDQEAVEKAIIPIEKAKASILLISANQDEMWPSTAMSEKVIERLEKHNYQKHYEHLIIDGKHAEVLKHFDKVVRFLDEHFPRN